MLTAKIKKIISLILALMLLGFIISGCAKDTLSSISKGTHKEIKIGVTLYKFNDTFISTVKADLEKEAKQKAGATGEKIIIDIVDAKGQQDLQNNQIDTFIAENYDVIAVNMVDRMVASVIIDKAKASGIPIVFFNREPLKEDMAKWNKVFYVGAKAEESGTMQGQIAADYWKIHPEADLNNDGVMQYVMLEGEPGHQDAILRTEYAIKAIEDAGIGVEKLACDTGNWQRAQGKDKMVAWLTAFDGRIEMVLANNDDMGLGAIDALKAAGYFTNDRFMPVISVDATVPALDALKAGQLLGTVLNDANGQGKGIFDIAYAFAQKEDPRKIIPNITDEKYLWVPYQPLVKDKMNELK